MGSFGDGTLSVEAGGTVSNTVGILGNYSGSTGTATVTGAGSAWTNSTALYVGSSGDGTLNVQAGGSVSNTVGLHRGQFGFDGHGDGDGGGLGVDELEHAICG